MSTPPETERAAWPLPGLILWAFAPAILMSLSIMDGWYADHGIISPGQQYESQAGVGIVILFVGVFGMPFILYPWSVITLRQYAIKRFVVAALAGIPLSAVMCGINLAAGFAGCSAMTKIIPKTGIL